MGKIWMIRAIESANLSRDEGSPAMWSNAWLRLQPPMFNPICSSSLPAGEPEAEVGRRVAPAVEERHLAAMIGQVAVTGGDLEVKGRPVDG
ncbi:hypothetical protein [Streptomyces microflavus]|uniref:hypothetical protein n=1 Tax=Streptomyces microflavus TaxID=1919 RepID=UPI001E4EFC9F|nr:hypothetical protein [Streptomyces microflavus]